MLISIGNVEVLQTAVNALHAMLEETKRAGAEEDARFDSLEAEVQDSLRTAHGRLRHCRETVKQCTIRMEQAELNRARAEAKLEDARAQLESIKYYG